MAKKIGLGTRPSEIKGRGRDLDIDEPRFDEPRLDEPRFGGSGGRPRRPARGSRPRGKLLLALGALAAVVLLLAGVRACGFARAPAVDQLIFSSGDRLIAVRPGESFEAPYRSGLRLQNVRCRGLHRYFPPADLLVSVADPPLPVHEAIADILALLTPETRLSYEFQIFAGEELLGTVGCTLVMTAQDWIARAEGVDDKQVREVCYRKAVELNPDAEDAHVALGRLYQSQGSTAKAIAAYEQAVRINAVSIPALTSLAALYEKTRNNAQLLQVYEKLAAAQAQQADGHYHRAGELAEKLGRQDKAMELYRKALAHNRAHLQARQNLIKLYEKAGEWNRVAGNAVVLIEYVPGDANLYIYLSDAYLRMGQVRPALDAARKAEELKPGDESICLQLALVYERNKQDDKALAYYAKALRLNPRNAAAANNAGLLFEKQGKRKEAIQHYEKAVSLEPGNAGFLTNLADAYEKGSQWSKAAATYEKLVKIDGKNKAYWESLAVVHEKGGSAWKAVEAYQKLADMDSRNSTWHKKLAQLYEQLGRLDRARDAYKRVLDIEPANQQARQKYVELSKRQVLQGGK
jgi:tetratricopeptide (TPR) repeat protein